MAISDIVVIIIFVATVIVCTVKGLALTLYSTFSTLIAVVGSFLLRPFVTAGLTAVGADRLFYDGIYNSICNVKTEMFGDTAIGTGSQLAEGMKLPDFAKGILESNVSSWKVPGSLDTIVEEMSEALSSFIVSAISFILLIVIIMVVMHLLKQVLTVFSKIPVIKQINKLGGFIAGIILAFVWISLLGIFLHIFSTAEFFSAVAADLDKSMAARYFYNTNFIALLISKLTT